MSYRYLIGDGVGDWVAFRSGGGKFPTGTATAIGLELNGILVAGMMFENYNGASVVAHMAIEGRITRGFLWMCADYAFMQLGVNKIIAPVATVNERIRRVLLKMSFWPEAVIADAHPEGGIELWTLEKRMCRFLGGRYGKAYPAQIA